MRTLSLLLLCSIVLFKATGQAGSLDPTFGNNGIQTAAFLKSNTSYEEGRAVLTNPDGDIFVVVQVNNSVTRIVKYLPDWKLDSSYGNAAYSSAVSLSPTSAIFQGDKIIAAGSTGSSFYRDFALARYTADGTLDSSFGVNGKITTDFNNADDQANAIALQGDMIIVAGSSSSNFSDFALARYTADGILDSSFGKNGLVTTDFDNLFDGANSIVVQGDKIIVAGYAGAYIDYGTSDFALAFYTANGALDRLVRTNFNGHSDDYANAMVLQGDKIIVAGNTTHYDPFYTRFALARYTTDGILDASFGENGLVTTDFNNLEDHATAIALQGDKIVVGGSTLARYTADGRLDASFGVNGKVTPEFGVNSITLQGDKIIVVGANNNSVAGNYDFALARYTGGGALDASFGEQGLLTGYFPAGQTSFTSTVIHENKILAAGSTVAYNNTSDFVLASYMADGTLDSSFGVNGLVTTDFDSSNDAANAIALQENKIIAAGSSNGNFALARYMANGTLDSSFGVNGLVRTNFNGNFEGASSIVLQENKIIVAGNVSVFFANNTSGFTLARYTANGALDSTFGENGKVTTDLYNANDGVNSIALQGDKILVAGYTGIGNSVNFALARYTTDGILDSSFGVNGTVTTDFKNLDDWATSIALQGDKIIVAGYTYINISDFAIARYTANGTLDSSFGVNGLVITDFNNSGDVISSIALQGDKIIAAGYSNGDFALARYTSNGTLDSSFGVNGLVSTHLSGTSSINAITVHESRLYAVGSLNGLGESYGAIAAYQLETPEPTTSLSIEDVTVPESKKFAVVTVRLSAPATKWVRVHFTTRDKTATAPQDYLSVQGTLLFIPGVNTIFKIYIPIVDDNACEGTEQFEVVLTNAHNATIKDSIGVVTITDDDNALIAKQGTSLRIYTTPNPSASAFTIQLQGSNLKQQASIRVYDISGRLIEQRESISLGQILHLGDQYKPGTYIIEALQGARSVQTKVIKTSK